MVSLGGVGALLLADARLPTGGHTQSAGLEPALLGGMPESGIADFLVTKLRTTTLVDAATAVVTLSHPHDIDSVIDAWAARTPSQVVRAASYEAGRGYLRVLQRVSGVQSPIAAAPRPVAMGLLAAHLSVTATDLARLVCHDDVQTICAAALKLAPGDPLDTVQWALAVAPDVEAIVALVADPPLTEPDGIPAASAPLLELWQHHHATAPRRLFRA